MPSLTYSKSDICNDFFAPLPGAAELGNRRGCPVLADLDWVAAGVVRALHPMASGRDFIQTLSEAAAGAEIGRSHYFETLKSRRRLALVAEVAGIVAARMGAGTPGGPDALAALPGLEGFEVFAGDGHWHAHAAHDPAKPRGAGGGESKYPTGHLYGIDLRTRAAFHLTACDEVARKKEHDIRALKRLDPEALRRGAPRGKKVIWVWDRAGIDFNQWHRWKQSKGIYFISRAKANMNTAEVAPREWCRRDPANAGVEADGIILGAQQTMVRLVRYRCPVSGDLYEFVTNEMTLPPGAVAHLYRMRWDIEKTFDGFKNKLCERKAWASSPQAKSMQAHFICLAHNLVTLYERRLAARHGIANAAEDARRAKRLAADGEKAKARGADLPDIYRKLSRATQFPQKFIRWLRIHLFRPTSREHAHAQLKRHLATL